MISELEIIRDSTVLEILPVTQENVHQIYTNPTPQIIEIVTTGPQGPAGESGGGEPTIEVVAAEDIPAFSAVTAQGNVGDSSNTAHYGKVVGIAQTDVTSGFIATLVVDTELTNPLWSWSPNTILFLNGTLLSATPPSSGFSQVVAVARNATTIIVRLEPPILL